MMAKSKVKFNKNDLSGELSGVSSNVLEAMARTTEAETKKNILRGEKSGEYYTVPKTSREYQASAPGEAPANRTGALAQSYNSKLVSDSMAIVFSNLKYSKIEFGWGYVAPRPHLRPAHNKTMANKNKIISTVTKRIK